MKLALLETENITLDIVEGLKMEFRAVDGRDVILIDRKVTDAAIYDHAIKKLVTIHGELLGDDDEPLTVKHLQKHTNRTPLSFKSLVAAPYLAAVFESHLTSEDAEKN